MHPKKLCTTYDEGSVTKEEAELKVWRRLLAFSVRRDCSEKFKNNIWPAISHHSKCLKGERQVRGSWEHLEYQVKRRADRNSKAFLFFFPYVFPSIVDSEKIKKTKKTWSLQIRVCINREAWASDTIGRIQAPVKKKKELWTLNCVM